MLLLDGIVLGLVLGLLTGGSFARFARVHLKGECLFMPLLAFQLIVPRLATALGLAPAFALALWVTAMCGLIALALWNRHWAGLSIAALGIALNVVVIVANGAMPVSLDAIARLDPKLVPNFDLVHEQLTDETRLQGLADVIAVPGPKWHRGVASPGDLLLSAGAGIFVFSAMRKKSEEG
ncbi:MAG: hypothetical protein D9V44_03715 [Actinobacteria bacterium]|nr:MAG: hypothetical protein D9V44_03715 [Actinomycetota bacterium]